MIRAAAFLRENFAAPTILIGHSLGGAAVLAAAAGIPGSKAVVTIGAPADVSHVLKHFGSSLEEIRSKGEAQVTLGGRRFRIRRSFIEDAEDIVSRIASAHSARPFWSCIAAIAALGAEHIAGQAFRMDADQDLVCRV